MITEYCVYKHTCPNGKVYIGMTRQEPHKRWANGLGYQTQVFGRAISKYGWENITHEIVQSHLTKEEAEGLEIDLIQQLNAMNKNCGYNRDAGGKGSTGHGVSDCAREKMRKTSNKTWGDPQKRAFLLNHLKKLNKSNTGKNRPREATRKTADALSKCVSQYTKGGNFIRSFKSISEAARAVGCSNSQIVGCCKGKRKTAHGYIWKYAEEYLSIKEVKDRNAKNYRKTPIVMCDDAWNEIKRFDGFHDADREIGVSYKAIYMACKTGRRCNGYRWKYL